MYCKYCNIEMECKGVYNQAEEWEKPREYEIYQCGKCGYTDDIAENDEQQYQDYIRRVVIR